jgi:hypothetical protein
VLEISDRTLEHKQNAQTLVACSHCGAEFRPLRRSARFCGSTCRVAAHRKTDCNANSGAHNAGEGPRSARNGSRVHAGRSAQINTPTATKHLSVTRDFAIVPDAKWPGMHRIRRLGGSLSDLVNLTRAKDALRSLDGGAA